MANRPSFANRIAQADPETLIAVARLLASSLSLVAVFLDPTTPHSNVTETYTVLCLYVAVSIILLVLPAPPRWREHSRVAQTAIDVFTLGLLAHYSDDLQSPFFVFFTFALISATMRWGWRGVLATAVLLQLLLVIVAIPDMRADGDWSMNVLLMRFVYAWVAALMLGYFGSYRARNERRLQELASWPIRMMPDDDRPWLAEALQHAARVLGTDHIVVVWQDQDEGHGTIGFWTGDHCEFVDRVTLPAPLSELKAAAAADPRRMLRRLNSRGGSPAWNAMLGGAKQSLHLAEFKGIRYHGLVIVIDPAFRDENVEAFTRIIGARIALALEQFSIANGLAAAASLKERVRVMRDIHDSVLQDLTAAVWQLDATRATLPPDAQPVMNKVRNLLQQQHTRLRTLLNGSRTGRSAPSFLRHQLHTLVEPLATQWACRLDISVEPENLRVSDETATELCLALSEATANAVRHGSAAALRIDIRARHGDLQVEIADDGCGLEARAGLPQSLCERMADLGGTLVAAGSTHGCRLRLVFPIGAVNG
ncbi:histidine kinase [Novosphingobium sp. PhB165]|uniref:sensor histidine kinase n=1 Tax=Novosphingobium sp. PhB165 TaxID=2485105 RepID=UPI001405098C|nr:histidine kinase [Novosphingobium sp. PhB165]